MACSGSPLLLLLQLPRSSRSALLPPRSSRTGNAASVPLAKADLLHLISDQERGVRTETLPTKRKEIIESIDALEDYGKGSVTTGAELSGTWRMLWTTEKEQLFIIKKAALFGTETGDVLQVIDVERGILNNVITFPPDGVFFVRSTAEAVSSQRIDFRSVWLVQFGVTVCYHLIDLFYFPQVYKCSFAWQKLASAVATIWSGMVTNLFAQ